MPSGYSLTALSRQGVATVREDKGQRRRADTLTTIATRSGISNENLEEVWGRGWNVNYS